MSCVFIIILCDIVNSMAVVYKKQVQIFIFFIKICFKKSVEFMESLICDNEYIWSFALILN